MASLPPTEACEGLEDRSCAALERFLRARKFDVAVTAAMFLEHRRWRASFAPTPWVQGPDDVATQLAQRKVAMQGLCRDNLPFVIVIARNHYPTGREGVPELHRAFVYIMDVITAAAGPGTCNAACGYRGMCSPMRCSLPLPQAACSASWSICAT